MPTWDRLDIYERDHFRCCYCGFDGSRFETWPFLEIDHINPLGPRNDPSNLATCCRMCNSSKGYEPCETIEQGREIVAQHRKANLAYWEKYVAPRINKSA